MEMETFLRMIKTYTLQYTIVKVLKGPKCKNYPWMNFPYIWHCLQPITSLWTLCLFMSSSKARPEPQFETCEEYNTYNPDPDPNPIRILILS